MCVSLCIIIALQDIDDSTLPYINKSNYYFRNHGQIAQVNLISISIFLILMYCVMSAHMYYKSWVLFIKDNFIKMVLISIYQNSSVTFVKLWTKGTYQLYGIRLLFIVTLLYCIAQIIIQ